MRIPTMVIYDGRRVYPPPSSPDPDRQPYYPKSVYPSFCPLLYPPKGKKPVCVRLRRQMCKYYCGLRHDLVLHERYHGKGEVVICRLADDKDEGTMFVKGEREI